MAYADPGSLPNLAERGRPRLFPRGTVLMRQGERAESMYLIVRGAVRVERSGPTLIRPLHLADLGAGQVVGEIGILNRTPRTATVTAISDVQAVELSRLETLRALREVPGMPTALQDLVSARLADIDAKVADEYERAAARLPVERRWLRQFELPWPLSATVTLLAHVEQKTRDRPALRPLGAAAT